ncbi:MAG: microcin ABC transporter ATP-binding protein [Rickettsiales bacterium]|nr:microcin ABC transporter ATP-binding protein [Rickettsiales bacterium]OUV99625.1 MAG: microcin ABC transporter ATP-binding protein [Betaproteobacteria bacterium TMED156]|tara:strand:+ start:59 stop:1639 length:1581 start_codon:yes stop_codon:yes gene_type:complete
MKSLLEIKNLSITFEFNDQIVNAVKDSSFKIKKGECLAIVGESGSGKSVTALAIMRLIRSNSQLKITGSAIYEKKNLLNSDELNLQNIRGKKISMIFQEPMTSLNPLHNIEKQITECLALNQKSKKSKCIQLLKEVGIENPEQRLYHFPHQLSGGQRQRVMIAMAIANNPDLLIADEPTTALDVTIQKQILDLLDKLRKKYKMSLLLITHDLGIVKKIAHRVCVMEKGKIVEQNTTSEIFSKPKHIYTKKLINSKPREKKNKKKNNEIILSVKNLSVYYKNTNSFFFKNKNDAFQAVKNLNFEIAKGETLGIVGESGSGKSSIAQALIKLIDSEGNFFFKNKNISNLNEKNFRSYRKNIQIIFQDPFASLSPRLTVQDIVSEGLEVHNKEKSKKEMESLTKKIIQDVGLDSSMLSRYPHEFSGGQRQRIAIARALILNPDLIILDEPTSALDMTVQSQIVDLLLNLQETKQLTYIFISHDLKIVKALSDKIMVMKSGKIIEFEEKNKIFLKPKSEYTKQLLGSAYF